MLSEKTSNIRWIDQLMIHYFNHAQTLDCLDVVVHKQWRRLTCGENRKKKRKVGVFITSQRQAICSFHNLVLLFRFYFFIFHSFSYWFAFLNSHILVQLQTSLISNINKPCFVCCFLLSNMMLFYFLVYFKFEIVNAINVKATDIGCGRMS